MIYRFIITGHFFKVCLFMLAMAPQIASTQANTESPNQQIRNKITVRQASDRWHDQTSSVIDILSPGISWTVYGSGPFAHLQR